MPSSALPPPPLPTLVPYTTLFRSHGPRGGGLMRVHGKRYRGAVAALEPRKLYATREAVEKVKAAAYAKFDESVDVAVRLGVDPKHADRKSTRLNSSH